MNKIELQHKVELYKKINPIDIHVGMRIRLRRLVVGVSQQRLGEALGIAFQQVQKYEAGINRISAARLFDLSRALNVPIRYFFDDESGDFIQSDSALHDGSFAACLKQYSPAGDDPMTLREALELSRAFNRITNVSVRKHVLDLVKSLESTTREQT